MSKRRNNRRDIHVDADILSQHVTSMTIAPDPKSSNHGQIGMVRTNLMFQPWPLVEELVEKLVKLAVMQINTISKAGALLVGFASCGKCLQLFVGCQISTVGQSGC